MEFILFLYFKTKLKTIKNYVDGTANTYLFKKQELSHLKEIMAIYFIILTILYYVERYIKDNYISHKLR